MNKWLSHNANVVALLGNLKSVPSYVRLVVSESQTSLANVSLGREIMPTTSSLQSRTGNQYFRESANAVTRIVSMPTIL